jgi:hypothetical protein
MSSTALASLGGNESSIQSDEAAFKVNEPAKKISCSTTVGDKFKVRACVGKHSFRQYITLDGSTIFAITWSGPTHGNHMKLLGRFTDEVQKAHQDFVTENSKRDKNHKTRAPFLHLKTNDNNVVYERSGHMGALSGRIYVPALMPQNVTAEDIQ